MDLIDLKPYFHGTARRSGAPCCFGIGLPYAPIARNASSLVASVIVSPSVYGQGYQVWRWPDATDESRKVCMTRYFADDSGFASSTSLASGNPDQGIAMPHASTQRWR